MSKILKAEKKQSVLHLGRKKACMEGRVKNSNPARCQVEAGLGCLISSVGVILS